MASDRTERKLAAILSADVVRRYAMTERNLIRTEG